VDLSVAALARAREGHPGPAFACADGSGLPLSAGSADLLLDRGCFHYPAPAQRAGNAREAGRVLRPGGRLLPRICLNSAGVRNGLDEQTIRVTRPPGAEPPSNRLDLVSDTRAMTAITAILVAPRETFATRPDTIELMPE
jgi:SAM-dependent methyltransferase